MRLTCHLHVLTTGVGTVSLEKQSDISMEGSNLLPTSARVLDFDSSSCHSETPKHSFTSRVDMSKTPNPCLKSVAQGLFAHSPEQ